MAYKQHAIYMLGLLLVGFFSIKGSSLGFTEGGLPEFIARHVPENDQIGYNNYYQALTELLNISDEEKQNNTFKYLYELALRDLKENHQEWFEAIQPLIQKKGASTPEKDNQRLALTNFLRRYGAYQEYTKNRGVLEPKFSPDQMLTAQAKTEEVGFWDTISSYFSKVTETVAGWFGFNKKETVI